MSYVRSRSSGKQRQALLPMNSAEGTRDVAVAVVFAQFSEVWNSGKTELIPEIYTDDFVGHFPGGAIHGHDGIGEIVTHHRHAFPDWTEQIEDLVVDGDKVAVRFTSTGTNQGPNRGRPATDRSVQITEMAIYRIVDGRIAEQWVVPDTHSLLQQLYGDSEQPAR